MAYLAGHYDENSKVRAINSDLGGVYNIGTVTVNAANTTTFDATKIPNYNSLTNANFIVQINSGTQANASADMSKTIHWCHGGIDAFSISKTYNSSTGKLSVSGFPRGYCYGNEDGGVFNRKAYPSISITAYVITGTSHETTSPGGLLLALLGRCYFSA